jgi:enhancing lycopene biosynthesis protein 2
LDKLNKLTATRKKVAMILSGCGELDGSEIHETMAFIFHLSEAKADVHFFAPEQSFFAVDHLSGEASQQSRKVLQEASRITRSPVRVLSELRADDFDALVFPGGRGVVKTLSNWEKQGARCEVLPELSRIIREFHAQSKPIGAVCLAPLLLAKVLGKENITITMGSADNFADEISKTGSLQEACPADDFVTDRAHKIITSPAYNLDAEPHEIFRGIRGLVKELWEMA